MDLSIIIVNWNSIEFTQACAASIHSTTTGLQYEVIVVDNASEAESCRKLSESIAEVKVVCLPRNIGFAAANNLGVDHSSGRVILFLNPDTLVLGDAIQHLFVRLNSSPDWRSRMQASERRFEPTNELRPPLPQYSEPGVCY